MNKKKFLKLLEEKLRILSDEERKDIINEYKDTIEEKVRHGSSEEEAVADFGSLEELSREILKAYKINPDYGEDTSSFKDIVDESGDMIKKSAKKLSDWTKVAVEEFKSNDYNWTLETVFEMIIKILLLLVGLALLKIPFFFIEHLGISIFEMAFPPVDWVLKFIWRCLIGIIYFVICIMILINVLKPYFASSKKESKKKEVKNDVKIKEVPESGNKKKSTVEPVKEDSKERNNLDGIVSILKGFIFLIFVFPLYCIDFGCYIAVAVITFLLVQGVPVLGLLLLLLSISIFFTFLTRFCYQLLYGGKKMYGYSLIVSAILFAAGCFMLLSTLSDFSYYRGLPNNRFKTKQVTYKETITSDHFTIPYWDYEVSENNNLKDNEIEILVTYYSDFITDLKNYKTSDHETDYMHFKTYSSKINRSCRKKLYHLIIDELKEFRWYEYRELRNLHIIIKANANTIEKIG